MRTTLFVWTINQQAIQLGCISSQFLMSYMQSKSFFKQFMGRSDFMYSHCHSVSHCLFKSLLN